MENKPFLHFVFSYLLVLAFVIPAFNGTEASVG
jgi:hypothetical protein